MNAPSRPNHAPEVKAALCDVRRVIEALGLFGEGRRRARTQGAGFVICCPAHDENTPSCSVQYRDGMIKWRCHGCDAHGDALTLVALVHGLNMKSDFPKVLLEAARLGGLWHIVSELEGREVRGPIIAPPRRPPPPERPRTYPDGVDEFWASCGLVTDDVVAADYLRGRGIDPDLVDAKELARSLPRSGALPRWASYRGDRPVSLSWREDDYRIIVPAYDHAGVMRSVRAWRVTPGPTPKRLPPSGHLAAKLVMADAFGLAMLRGERAPKVVAIVEGEPDLLSRCVVQDAPDIATIGITSGSWCREFAERVPVGATVAVRTDLDRAGDKYAAEIIESLKRRAFVRRLVAST